MYSYAIQCGFRPLIHTIYGHIFYCFAEAQLCAPGYRFPGSKAIKMILALKTAVVHLQDKHVHTLLQPGIIYLGSGVWALIEG